MRVWAIDTTGTGAEVGEEELMPSQSPGVGVVAVPSPLLSPPALSSFQEVNTTGVAAVPATFSVPSPVTPSLRPDFTTGPAAIVKVTPVGTLSVLSMR